MTAIIGVALAKIGSLLATGVAKASYAKLTEVPPVAKAIDETQTDFPNLEVKNALLKWCASSHFKSLLDNVEAGKRAPLDSEIVRMFIQEGEFYTGGSTELDAEAVLQRFAKGPKCFGFNCRPGSAMERAETWPLWNYRVEQSGSYVRGALITHATSPKAAHP
jgi:hypothetical protein